MAEQDWSAVPGPGMLCVPLATRPGAMPELCAARDSPKAGPPAGSWPGLSTAPTLLAEPGRPRLPSPRCGVCSCCSCPPASPACPPAELLLPRGAVPEQQHPVPCPLPCQGLLLPRRRGAVPGTPVLRGASVPGCRVFCMRCQVCGMGACRAGVAAAVPARCLSALPRAAVSPLRTVTLCPVPKAGRAAGERGEGQVPAEGLCVSVCVYARGAWGWEPPPLACSARGSERRCTRLPVSLFW